MYLDYFGFREKPFNVTPDPRLFYNNAVYQETYAGLLYGIRERKGFISLIGEVGTGKTTLLRKLMSELREPVHFVYVCYTTLTFEDLLSFICADLGLQVGGKSHLQRIQLLNEFLVEVAKENGTGVLLVDEAQNLGDDVLENLRLLSNLETASEKLLQIVLVGQPELERKLAQPKLRQLKQRIAIQGKLGRLKEREVGPFIYSRLAAVGYEAQDLFAPETVQRIAMYSRGTPRLINVICDNALLVAYSLNQPTVSPEIVEEVARDLQLRADTRVQRLETATGTLSWQSGTGTELQGNEVEQWQRTGENSLAGAASRIATTLSGAPLPSSQQPYPLVSERSNQRIMWIAGGSLLALLLLGALGLVITLGQSFWGMLHKMDSVSHSGQERASEIAPRILEGKDQFSIGTREEPTTTVGVDTPFSSSSSSMQASMQDKANPIPTISPESRETISPKENNSEFGEKSSTTISEGDEEKEVKRVIKEPQQQTLAASYLSALPQMSPLTIEPGMTVFDLVRKNYGNFNTLAFDLIEEVNPHIPNLEKIVAGQQIWLPPLTLENLIRQDEDGLYRVIAASFRTVRDAEGFASTLRGKGYTVVVVRRVMTATLILQRVEIQQLKGLQDVQDALALVKIDNILFPTT